MYVNDIYVGRTVALRVYNMTPAQFAEMKAFLLVVEERSFRRAAKRFGLSPSAFSRTIRSLEERLGVRLLNRTTRSVAPTEAGQSLYDRSRPMLTGMEEALREVGASQDRPRGLVRINLPSIAARLAIMPRLGTFTLTYPDIRLDLVVDNNITDVVAEGFDAGVRTGDQISRDMIAVRLTPDLRMVVVGAPEYFEHHSPPLSPHDLTDHLCLTYKWDRNGALMPWRLDGPAGGSVVDVESVFTANDTDLLLSAALQGVGLAYLVESVVAPYLQSGALVRVLEKWSKPIEGFHLYYSERRYMPAALRVFIDHIKCPSR